MWIKTSVTDKDLGLHGARFWRLRSVKASVNTDDPGDIRTASSEFEHRHAAKTIPDCRGTIIDERMRSQYIESGAYA